jgi:class 3 adenylate cyclase
MSALVEILAGYVPAFVAQRLVAHPAALEEPLAEQFEAGVLFADITGFTALSEQLAQQGPQGAETISCILNEYFGALIDLIHAYGGDVVKFAGDALLAIWIAVPEAGAGGRAMRAAPLRRAARAAARCALEIRDRLNNYYVEEGGLMRCVGVSASHPRHDRQSARWEYLLLGEAITDASLAEGLAQAGELVLSAEAWRLVGGDPQAEATPLEGAGGWVRLEYQGMPPVHPLHMPELDADTEAALRTMCGLSRIVWR